MRVLQLRTGDLNVGKEGDVLFTGGIGSCVVVCLWDSTQKLGGMAHMLLPQDDSGGRDLYRSPGLSPDTAIPSLLNRMKNKGAVLEKITARLVGAGNMFPQGGTGFMADIGSVILCRAVEALNKGSIIVQSQSVGGNVGRQVHFNVSTGEVQVQTVNGNRITL